MKMFGNDLAFMTCDDLHAYQRKLSLSTAGVVVKLLKVRSSFSSRYLKEYFKGVLSYFKVTFSLLTNYQLQLVSLNS